MDQSPTYRGAKEKVMILLHLFVAVLAWGAAAPTAPAPSGFSPEMRESTYQPQRQRDPFLRTDLPEPKTPEKVQKDTPVRPIRASQPKPKISASAFRLQAILRDHRGLLAVVNGERLELNKPVQMPLESERRTVKAVEIGRDYVVLEVQGQRLKVRMEEASSEPKPR